MELKRHPYSAAWPDMKPEDAQALRDSLSANGLREPIVLFQGEVLDGWQRYTACATAGVPLKTVAFNGDDEAAKEFVKDKHTRRPLDLTQRMTCIALMHQHHPRGRIKSAPGADLPMTAAKLAAETGGSERTAERVQTAVKKGSKALVEAMKDGTVSAKRAEQIAQLPVKEQSQALKAKKPEPEDVEYFGPSQEEIDAAEADAKQDTDTLNKLMEADDKLAAAVALNEQLRAELAVVKISRDGYMNRSNELIERIKSLKKKLAKLEQANA